MPRFRGQCFHLLFHTKTVVAIVTVGIDLAKKVFAMHGVVATGKPALVRPSALRAKLMEPFEKRRANG